MDGTGLSNGTAEAPNPAWLAHRGDCAVPASGPGKDWIAPILVEYLQGARDFQPPGAKKTHPARILVLHGTLRERGFSKLLSYECARILEGMGAEVRSFDPRGLPVRDPELQDNPKVVELRSLVEWSEGHVWCGSELHGNLCSGNKCHLYFPSSVQYAFYLSSIYHFLCFIPSVLKNTIDWIPLNTGSVRPTQGKSVAVLQVNGGSQSFNVVNTLRLLARWMRMPCVVNQSSVSMAWKEFDDDGRMKESSMRSRVVDVMEEMHKFLLINREYADFLNDRYSERQERAEAGRLLTQFEKEQAKDAAALKAKANE